MVGAVVFYTRVSKDPDGTSTSPQAQYDECAALARELGWERIEHRSDVDTSAWSRTVARPGYRATLAGIREGSVDGLVVSASHRGTGIGKKLMQFVEDIARQNSPVIIDLTSSPSRARDGAHEFYKRIGYQNEGATAKLYLQKEL